MKNFFKSNWIAITVCLVCALAATGGAMFFVKKSAQDHHAASLKSAEDLQAAAISLEKANAETAIIKEAWEKEKALNGDLKKMIADADSELDKLRNSLKTIASSGASKTPKPAVARPPAVAAAPECRPAEAKFSPNKIRALQNLQADLNRRDKDLKEKQKRLDEAMENVAREKRKVTLQNSEYRWPHDAEAARKSP